MMKLEIFFCNHQNDIISLVICKFLINSIFSLICSFTQQIPLSIDPPEEMMEAHQDSLSPIVIHDRLLSQSAVNAPSMVPQFKSLLTPKDLEIYRAIQQGARINGIDVMNSDNITSFLREFDRQDYRRDGAANDGVNDEENSVNELLQIM